jgi:uncharacterized membrane protein YphA (DoxX/SURF4 family)
VNNLQLRWLAAARIYVGLLWFVYGTSKFGPKWTSGLFLSAVKECISSTTGPIHDFLANIVVPNQAVFGQAIAVGETLVGVSLVLGLLTKAGAAGGMFLSFTYYLATGKYSNHLGIESLELLLFVTCTIMLVLPSGRCFSLDALIHRFLMRSKPQGRTPGKVFD